MDAPVANRAIEWFCERYKKQAKKEEKEVEDLVKRIDSDVLKALCTRYDNKIGEYLEHEHEGAAVFEFFEKMKEDAKQARKEK